MSAAGDEREEAGGGVGASRARGRAGASPAAASAGLAPGGVGRRGLARLLAARLVLAVFAFVLALALSPEGRTGTEVFAPWAVLAFAFFSTALSAAWMERVRSLRAFGAIQLVTDVAVVTALVHFSGS